jgi:leucyl aminopeptidase
VTRDSPPDFIPAPQPKDLALSLALVDMQEAVSVVPLHLATKASLPGVLASLDDRDRAFAASVAYSADSGATLLMPGADGKLARIIVGTGEPIVSHYERDLWSLAALPTTLPPGTYRLSDEPGPAEATAMALGWALGAYAYEDFKERKRAPAALVWPSNADRDRVAREWEGVCLARDLINKPANHLGPQALEDAALALAGRHGATTRVVKGQALLDQNYPLIYHVGRAGAEEPRLVDFAWGELNHPRVTLVGKGVTFDTGGLDLKPPASMKIMKKDMAGAASVLAIAHMVMAAKLGVRLRVLLPIVENAVSAAAFRPLDVLPSRKGVTIEIGNTDAEGRLILADALVEADTEAPDLLINMCTLTGNARIALGPELPAIFTRHDDLADILSRQSTLRADPLWRMPIWPHYRKQLDGKAAHLNNVSESAFAGAIVAALFLSDFVSPQTRWVHVDLSGWNFGSRPGRPEGGDTQGARALFGIIEELALGSSRA